MAKSHRRRNTYRGLSPEQRDAERRARILASGLALFARQGLDGGTVRALCAAAGVTTRQFYELFSDRDDAFAAVYEYAVALMLRRTAAAAAGAPPELEPQLRAALETNFLNQDNDLRNAQIVVFQLGSTNPRAWARRAAAADAVRDFITAAIQPAVAEPTHPGDDVGARGGAVRASLATEHALLSLPPGPMRGGARAAVSDHARGRRREPRRARSGDGVRAQSACLISWHHSSRARKPRPAPSL